MTKELKIDDESLAYLLNIIKSQIDSDREMAKSEYDRLSISMPDMDKYSAESIFVGQQLAQSLKGYLDSVSDASDKLLKLAKVLADRLNKSEVSETPIISTEERFNIEQLLKDKDMIIDRNA